MDENPALNRGLLGYRSGRDRWRTQVMNLNLRVSIALVKPYGVEWRNWSCMRAVPLFPVLLNFTSPRSFCQGLIDIKHLLLSREAFSWLFLGSSASTRHEVHSIMKEW
jgi:hypothetical protein